MVGLIEQELQSTGIANVIVILPQEEDPALLAKLASQASEHFALDDRSQLTEIMLAKGGPIEDAFPRLYPNLGVIYGAVRESGLAALSHDYPVLGAPHLSHIRPVSRRKTEREIESSWGLEQMKIPDLWREGLSGAGVLVGHLDTGVDGSHEALSGQIVDFNHFDDFGRPPKGSSVEAYDTEIHGTHTAGTIVGRKIPNFPKIGIAPGARLASGIVIEGGDVVARVLGGLDWLIEVEVRIISMSLGFRGWVPDFVQLIELVRNRGIIPIVAVGNEGPGTSRSPGNYETVLSVGAQDRDGSVAEFSSNQTFISPEERVVPDIIAPGVDIVSASRGGGYCEMSGTSMATPHVAGLAALLVEAKPNASVEEIENAIRYTASKIENSFHSRARYGAVDARRALAAIA